MNMKFPEKLWSIVNNCKSGAVGWNSSGDSICLVYELFRQEFLSGENAAFKTNNINSFVRQLNLYGFKKCNRVNDETHEFKHPFFMRNRRELLSRIYRKPGSLQKTDSTIKKLSVPKREFVGECENNSFLYKHTTSTPKRCEISMSDQSSLGSSSLNDSFEMPYLTYIENGWLPADAEFYNSQKPKSDEVENNRNDCFTPSHENSRVPYLDNSPNAYIFVVPGYAFQQFPFTNQDIFNGLMHFMVYPPGDVKSQIQ